MGLGLSICKGILNYLGTEIWLEKSSTKKKEHGSVFAFRIPVMPIKSSNSSGSPKSRPKPKIKDKVTEPKLNLLKKKEGKYNSAPKAQLEPILELDNEDEYMIDLLKNSTSERSESDNHSLGIRRDKSIKILIAEDAPLDRSILKVLFSETFKYS